MYRRSSWSAHLRANTSQRISPKIPSERLSAPSAPPLNQSFNSSIPNMRKRQYRPAPLFMCEVSSTFSPGSVRKTLHSESLIERYLPRTNLRSGGDFPLQVPLQGIDRRVVNKIPNLCRPIVELPSSLADVPNAFPGIGRNFSGQSLDISAHFCWYPPRLLIHHESWVTSNLAIGSLKICRRSAPTVRAWDVFRGTRIFLFSGFWFSMAGLTPRK